MNFVDKQMIINFFTDNACVESGYVLDFNRLSFSQFSIRALGKNILMDDLSVGKSLKKFINGASSHDILRDCQFFCVNKSFRLIDSLTVF